MIPPKPQCPPPAARVVQNYEIVYHGACPGGGTAAFPTEEQLLKHEWEVGMGGGHVEQAGQLYRCPDFDNVWRRWPDLATALAYYEHSARYGE